jgi:hypothetical protein
MSGWGVGSLAAASQIRDSHPCLRSAAKHAIRPQHTMNYASSITDLIGNTPLLALDRVRQGGGGRVFGKCEFMNPIAIKDRPVFHMIREA